MGPSALRPRAAKGGKQTSYSGAFTSDLKSLPEIFNCFDYFNFTVLRLRLGPSTALRAVLFIIS